MKSRPHSYLFALALISFTACNAPPGSETGPSLTTGTIPGSTSTGSGPSTTSSPPGAPAPQPTAIADLLDSEESAFLTAINDYRAQNGLVRLELSPLLTASSKWLSQSMATNGYFDHTDNLGRDPFTRMEAFGYTFTSWMGENIAAGNATAADTFTQWKNSPAHNANMLSSSYLVIGIGRYYVKGSPYGWYWTTDFGGTIDPGALVP